jgi:hypothetical protein
MSKFFGFLNGVRPNRVGAAIKATCGIILAVSKRYQTWMLLILAIDAYGTISSVLIRDFPGKAVFQLAWLLAFGAALIVVMLSDELGDTASRLGPVDRGRSPRHPLRSVTRLSCNRLEGAQS